MSDQLTIVLTLKDRSSFTHRWMRYMNDRACPYSIVIADGGEDHELESHLRHGEHYPRLRYEYLRYPVDQDYSRYYLKLADVIDCVTTPYVLLADNDDFFLLDEIPAFVQFLDQHPDYVSCGGQRVVLRLLDRAGTLTGRPDAAHYEARLDARQKSIEHESPVDRMRDFLATVRRLYLWAAWYRVHRTPALAAATRIAQTHQFRDPVAHELHVHLALLLAGKSRHVDRPFFVNQAGSSQFTSALEAGGTVAQRFAESHAIDDVLRSIETFQPALSPDDVMLVRASLTEWLAIQGAKTKAPPEVRPMMLPGIEPYILSA
jgi:glycosyltransferase domain-containing protein